MFDVLCPVRSQRLLVSTSQVRAVRNDTDGIHVSFACVCGSRHSVVTGRAAA